MSASMKSGSRHAFDVVTFASSSLSRADSLLSPDWIEG